MKIKHLLFAFNILLVVGLVLVFVQIVKYVPGVNEAVVSATTIKPETFTELYFENHTKLPHKFDPITKQSFSFTIHNLEYKDMTYSYEVYLLASVSAQTIDKGTIKLSQNGNKTINENVVLNSNIGRAKVVVNLTNKNQQINFWIGEIK
ncbi:MAG: hypothetical protein WD231_02790 [Candidatus Woykebacteria bacterium]